MTLIQYLATVAELGDRVYFPDYPHRVPSEPYARVEYDDADSKNLRIYDKGFVGIMRLSVYIYQPPELDPTTLQEITPDNSLLTLARNIALRIPKGVTADVSENLNIVHGSIETSLPNLILNDATYGRYCVCRVQYQVAARHI